ncbi:peptidase domain-containing ABC transporter [Azospirillum sp.]|uniref:peptidase domain-containing ABC transporter n=1 Tax=Azospirillum sp. TaxID=34012 RepID=UPI002D4065B1|nr:peptidase domain-containing ABC transporter [Azospirillum sp.]HYD64920.1 peptidase domain-containing ABC transporter [Azospirillum sp.]
MGDTVVLEAPAATAPPPTPAPPAHSALQCLVAVAGHHGIQTSVDRLVHDHVLPPHEPKTGVLLALARTLGLKATASKLTWAKLVGLGAVFPVLARLKNGNTVVVVGPRKEGDTVAVGVVDPLADKRTVFFVDEAAFCAQWQGETILLKRTYKITDEEQPFGLGWFVPEILKQKGAFRDIALAAIVLHFLGLSVPVFFQLVIDKVLVHHSISTLWVLAAGVAGAIAFESTFGFLRRYLLLAATTRIDMRLARRTFSHLLALPIDYFEATSAGVTVRHMQQVEKIRQFLTGRLFMTALDCTALFVFVPVLFLYSGTLATVTILFGLAIAAVVVALIGPFRTRLKALYDAEASRQAMLVESIQGMRTVKSSAIEPVQRRKWDQRTARAVDLHLNVGQISNVAQSITQVLERLMLVAVVTLGAQMVFNQGLSVGALIAFQMLAGRVVGPLVQIVGLVQEYQETALSVRMLAEVMGRPPERRTSGGLAPQLKGGIAFDRVTFRYGTNPTPALDSVSIDIPAGSVVGIVGKSGSGKTTLTRLIQGFHPVQQGVIRYDGIDIREIDLAHLRRSLGVVLQENFLFRGTVRENIAVTRPDAPFEEVVAAARLAGADEFIETLPQGYDTLLEENASNLSGGQRQRLAIARALLPRPRILILDEATSALDPDSEAIFMTNLAAISAGRTVLIVSHRLSTIASADLILVLDGGRVADRGTHAELLQRCSIYRHLWQTQNRHS